MKSVLIGVGAIAAVVLVAVAFLPIPRAPSRFGTLPIPRGTVISVTYRMGWPFVFNFTVGPADGRLVGGWSTGGLASVALFNRTWADEHAGDIISWPDNAQCKSGTFNTVLAPGSYSLVFGQNDVEITETVQVVYPAPGPAPGLSTYMVLPC